MEKNLQSSIHDSLIPFLPNNQNDLMKQIPNQSTLDPAFNHLLSLCADSIYNGFYKQCLDHCLVLLDITWEKLNTGHWKNVPFEWRICYSIISLFKACSQLALFLTSDTNSSLAVLNVIKSCDMGLLMGAPLEDNNLSKLASHVHQTFSSKTSGGSPEVVNLDSTERIKRKKNNLPIEKNRDLNLSGNSPRAEDHFFDARNPSDDYSSQVENCKIKLDHGESYQEKALYSFPENVKFKNPYSDKPWNTPKIPRLFLRKKKF